jgi:phosphorylcholine metabolism protein LicD
MFRIVLVILAILAIIAFILIISNFYRQRESYQNKNKSTSENNYILSPKLSTQDIIDWKHAQKKMTNMFQIFSTICTQHGIKYFAIGGTLIGTVRHKGWIPWDGDVDVAILEDDYNKFKKIKNELPSDLWLQTVDNDPLYKANVNANANAKDIHRMAKIRDLNSCYDQPGNFKVQSHSGLQIDLFIVKKDGDYIVSDINWDPNINKIKYNDVFPLKILKFEGIDINVPRKYKKYLKTVFGSESPKIPPIDDRIPHEGNGKVKPFETCEWFAKNYPQLYDR